MHAETLRPPPLASPASARQVWRGQVKLPFTEYSACPAGARSAGADGSLTSLGTIDVTRYASLVSGAAGRRTPGTQASSGRCQAVAGSPGPSKPRRANKYAGGHRSRVTPVPIPNTEVKPATADGTAWETVWESRSLPAVITTRAQRSKRVLGSSSVRRQRLQPTQFPMRYHRSFDDAQGRPETATLATPGRCCHIQSQTCLRLRDVRCVA